MSISNYKIIYIENMKPSEKIKEIYKLLGEATDGLDAVVKQIVAIQIYLDEEYERNKPCEHKGSSEERYNEYGRYHYCNKCECEF